MKATGKLSVKKIILGSVLLLLGIWVGVATFRFYVSEQPSDLGSGLRYVGKNDWGCTFKAPLLSFCPNGDHSQYFYATTMSEDQLVSYFKKAKLLKKAEGSILIPTGDAGSEELKYETLQFENAAQGFGVSYYHNTPLVKEEYRLGDIRDNEYVVEIDKDIVEDVRGAL